MQIKNFAEAESARVDDCLVNGLAALCAGGGDPRACSVEAHHCELCRAVLVLYELHDRQHVMHAIDEQRVVVAEGVAGDQRGVDQ